MGLSGRWFTVLSLPSPSIEGSRGHDRDQFGDGRAERQAKFEQPLALFGTGVNLSGDPRPQDLVFFFEVADLATKLRVSRAGDQSQQRVQQFGHGTAMVYALSG